MQLNKDRDRILNSYSIGSYHVASYQGLMYLNSKFK